MTNSKTKRTEKFDNLDFVGGKIMKIRIKMTKTVRGCFPLNPDGKIILRNGVEYEAKSNMNGAISGLCENGEWLGVKPDEFEFVGFPILCEFDRQHLKHYFETRLDEIEKLAKDEDGSNWILKANTAYGGIFDLLCEFLTHIQIQEGNCVDLKQIHNPVTDKYYPIRIRSSKPQKSGIKGLWEENE